MFRTVMLFYFHISWVTIGTDLVNQPFFRTSAAGLRDQIGTGKTGILLFSLSSLLTYFLLSVRKLGSLLKEIKIDSYSLLITMTMSMIADASPYLRVPINRSISPFRPAASQYNSFPLALGNVSNTSPHIGLPASYAGPGYARSTLFRCSTQLE
jgi:hypothetical protein